ncbi:hypothetical protein KK062_17170 [Fulvivirgaceae bacterium PWU5]|uniref:Lipoprotein n=1 Tax=Dawidia cretensis TaxID=2782350 RepID=A0AAP2GV71_9BACT|nr:BF3164 family lipoprotein [Dawidia cretensis]MBT1709980.1 hypothetical protein [Dawidia cretensis]
MKYSFLILVVLSLTTSCTTDHSSSKIVPEKKFDKFQSVYQLTGKSRKDMRQEDLPGLFFKMWTTDSLLIVYDIFAGKSNYFYIYNKYDYSLKSTFGRKGAGPGEGNYVGDAFFDQKNGAIFQHMQDKMKLFRYDLDSALALGAKYIPSSVATPVDGFFQEADDNNFYTYSKPATDPVNVGNSVLTVINRKTGSQRQTGTHFLKPDAFADNMARTNFTMGTLIVSPDKKRAVSGYVRWNTLAFLDLNDESKNYILTGPDEFTPKKDENGQIIRDINCNWGYYSIAPGGDYIFGVYYGGPRNVLQPDGENREAFPNTVHIFDWEGNAVAKLELSKYTDGIVVDWDRKMLITANPTAIDPIVEYDLSEVKELFH